MAYPNTHSSTPTANLILSRERLSGEVAFYCSWSAWRRLQLPLKEHVPPISRCILALQLPEDQHQPALLKNHSPSLFPAEMSSKPSMQNGPSWWSELLSYGPWGPAGKQVQIDSLWEKCLLKEQGKARRNYFLSWSGEKSIATRLESSRTQWHMWAHSMSMNFTFAKICVRLMFSGVHTSTQ